MNSIITRLARLPKVAKPIYNKKLITSIAARTMATSTSPTTTSKAEKAIDLQNFDPNNYSIEPRMVTMDDLMEPYGSWKEAYEKERKAANFVILRGFVCLASTLTLFYYSGVMDGLFMPNLDNIMEDTEPWNFDKEGRITV